MAVSCIIAIYMHWSKSRFISLAFGAAVRGIPIPILPYICCGKTVMWLPDGKKV